MISFVTVMKNLKHEWKGVAEMASNFANYVMADDAIAAERQRIELMSKLALMRENYGDHPSIVATQAEYCLSVRDRLDLWGIAYNGYLSACDLEGALSCATSAFRDCIENKSFLLDVWKSRLIDSMRCGEDAWEMSEGAELLAEYNNAK